MCGQGPSGAGSAASALAALDEAEAAAAGSAAAAAAEAPEEEGCSRHMRRTVSFPPPDRGGRGDAAPAGEEVLPPGAGSAEEAENEPEDEREFKRRFSEPDAAAILRMQFKRSVSMKDLIEGTAPDDAGQPRRNPSGQLCRTKSPRIFDAKIQSFDYQEGYGLPKKCVELNQVGSSSLGHNLLTRCLNEAQRITLLKWLLAIIIAFVVGLTAGGLILSSHTLVDWKLHLMEHWLLQGQGMWAFLLWLGYGLGSCLIATLLVTLVEPTAGGSGIPDVKAYLNGNLLPNMLCARTWFCRVIGLIFVTSSGLFAGTEGPMAHVGAITAAGLSMGRSSILHCQLRLLDGLDNHRTKLEFMSLGASIGVAAAFGAPIGGLLFSLEEASSFWYPQLTWRAFLGGCVASLVAKACKEGFKFVPVTGFIEFPDKDVDWKVWELVPFCVIGISLGLTGALFCECVRRMQQWRARVFRLSQRGKVRKGWRIMEALSVTALTMAVTYAVAWGMPCDSGTVPGPAEPRGLSSASSDHGDGGRMRLFSAICSDPEREASGVATVLLESREHAIKALFSKEYAHGGFKEHHLAMLFVIMFVLTLCTYGCSIPAGLFIPNIMIGACYGRLVGQLMQRWDSDVHPGIYALLGATGMLAGFSRMTVSLGVIVLEITSHAHLILPIMLVIMVSKLIGDCFTPSAYDIVIALKNIPMLEHEDESMGWQALSKHPASACGTACKDLHTVDMSSTFRVSNALEVLTTTPHNAWPVLDSPARGRLLGLLTRQRLLQCLEEHKTLSPVAVNNSPVKGGMVVVEDEDANGSGCDSRPLDIGRYLDVPHVVMEQSSLRTAYRTFRVLGLRHLCVVDSCHRLVSFITRTDLAEVVEEFVRPRVMRLRDFSAALEEMEEQDEPQDEVGIDDLMQEPALRRHVSPSEQPEEAVAGHTSATRLKRRKKRHDVLERLEQEDGTGLMSCPPNGRTSSSSSASGASAASASTVGTSSHLAGTQEGFPRCTREVPAGRLSQQSEGPGDTGTKGSKLTSPADIELVLAD